ncbi:ferredoxin-NADP reductase [Vibrio alginolyticus]|nr:ferredoxin-NADP reductase [Vibrio alginolyticus]
MVPQGLVPGKVVRRIDWTPSQFSITVRADTAPFMAGQFTKLALQDEQGEWVRRAYSIVNSPNEYSLSGELEFLIVAASRGELSPKLHQLQTGDTVWVGKDPAGFMTLEEVPEYAKELWLVSSGTAIGPYLSMLMGPHLSFETIVLVHAVRTEHDLVYLAQIDTQLQRYAGRLKYVPIVSRESVSGALSGRIPALLHNGELEKTATVSLNPERSFVYLCGNPAMVKEAGDTLKKKGLNKHLRRKPGHFSSENYW